MGKVDVTKIFMGHILAWERRKLVIPYDKA